MFLFSIKTYFLGGQRTSFLFKITLSKSAVFLLTDNSFDTFHWLLEKTVFSLDGSVHRMYFVIYKEDQRLSAVHNVKSANSVWFHLILNMVYSYSINKACIYEAKQSTRTKMNERCWHRKTFCIIFFKEAENFTLMWWII